MHNLWKKEEKKNKQIMKIKKIMTKCFIFNNFKFFLDKMQMMKARKNLSKNSQWQQTIMKLL